MFAGTKFQKMSWTDNWNRWAKVRLLNGLFDDTPKEIYGAGICLDGALATHCRPMLVNRRLENGAQPHYTVQDGVCKPHPGD